MGSLFTTWLGLIALQALVSRGGSGRVAEFFTDVNNILERALDPTVPAIPDLRTTGKATKAPRAAQSVPDTSPAPTPPPPPRLRLPQAI